MKSITVIITQTMQNPTGTTVASRIPPTIPPKTPPKIPIVKNARANGGKARILIEVRSRNEGMTTRALMHV